MADSLRQQIVSAIDTRLKTILISGGYETNAGNNVYEFWSIALEDSELPAIIWRDGAEDTELLVSTTQDRRMTVELTLQAVGTTAPATLRKVIADVEKAMLVDYTWGGLAIFTSPVDISDTFDMDHQERRIGVCRARFTVLYRTGYLDSYT